MGKAKPVPVVNVQSVDDARDRAHEVINHISSQLIRRDRYVKAIITALIAKQNVFLLGPPGTAKSMLSRGVCDSLSFTGGPGFFSVLIGKETTKNDLFGAPHFPSLKKGEYVLKLDRKLADCRVAFLDEIWKGSVGVNNGMLMAINERQFDNGDSGVIDIPLEIAVSASNEIPTSQESMALYDRFLFKFYVPYLTDRDDLKRLFSLKQSKQRMDTSVQLDSDQLDALRSYAALVDTEPVYDVLLDIYDDLDRSLGIKVSDRTKGEIVSVLQAIATLEGRQVSVPMDLQSIVPCLVHDPETDTDNVTALVAQYVCPDLDTVLKLERAATQLFLNGVSAFHPVTGDAVMLGFEAASTFVNGSDIDRQAANVCLTALNRELKKLVNECNTLDLSTDAVSDTADKIVAMQKQVQRAAKSLLGI